MLLQLYRCGPTKQRIQKGYIINGSVSKNDLKRSFSNLTIPAGKLHIDENQGRTLWLDSGLIWLHSARVREEYFRHLQESIEVISATLKHIGGGLTPNAVRTTRNLTWDNFLCSDRHFLKIENTVEREVTSNLLRLHVPTIIAYSGKSGIEQNGVELVGSRRLMISQEHYVSRYLVSLAPQHLERVKQCLRRDDGVSRLDYLDINPLANDMDPSLELRFIDGQALLSTVRAHAILIQALFIQARRLVREGRRVGDPDQKYLERNRARAIARAMQAQFEEEPERNRSDRSQSNNTHHRSQKRFVSADNAWLNLLEDLQREFQTLEVEYSEIAPLVLGTSLHQMGFAGLRNENDFFLAMSKSPEWQAGNWISQITMHVNGLPSDQLSPLQALNEKLYPFPAQMVRRWWTMLLRYDSKQGDDGKTSRDEIAPQNQKKQPSLHLASSRLVSSLQKLGDQYSESDLHTCLETYVQDSGENTIYRGLETIPHQDAQLVRQVFRSLQGQFKLLDLKKVWDDQGSRQALNYARRYGLCLLSFTVSQDKEPLAKSTLNLLQGTLPNGYKMYILSLWRFKANRDNTPVLKVEIILSLPLENLLP